MGKASLSEFHRSSAFITKKLDFDTRLIHCGNEPDSKFGGVAPAIDLSTTFAQPYPGKPVCYEYARCGNPTRPAI
jgi:cystathionine beta-lyase/cystathionine gamma-synthase